MIETLIYNVDVVTPERVSRGFVAIGKDGRIALVGDGEPQQSLFDEAANRVDGCGGLLMAGAIDCHVHFREPGLTHKATIASESRAAVAGGVTSFFDMPNTVPQTVTVQAVNEKAEIASRTSVANYAFFIGATNDNLDQLVAADYTRVAGVKLFMGSSTGNMLVDKENALCRLFEAAPAIISVHAEDEATIRAAREAIEAEYGADAPVSLHIRLRPAEACYKATAHAVELARRYGSRLHIAHLTTAAELALLDPPAPVEEKRITAEVSPHHLMWTIDDYERKGARIKMNPAVKTAEDRAALREALAEGRIDIVATDHAPHLMAEKDGSLFKAVSGAPMVQFSLPVMLGLYAPELVTRVMADVPARLFGVVGRGRVAEGYFADLVLVERLTEPVTVTDDDALSLCGWTPMAGEELHHKVTKTWVNGKLVYADGVIDDSNKGKQIIFNARR
ncbi:MAG: dihydroorotase [Muribaculaceae bacterium]|nr:dihydroorotase [Muribaculaceae bacterium]